MSSDQPTPPGYNDPDREDSPPPSPPPPAPGSSQPPAPGYSQPPSPGYSQPAAPDYSQPAAPDYAQSSVPGSYSAAPPPPVGGQGGGFAAAGAGGASGFNVGDAFAFGWKKFQQNLGVILLASLAYVVVIAVVSVLWALIVGGIFAADPTTVDPVTGQLRAGSVGVVASLFSSLLIALVVTVLVSIMQAGIIRGALHIATGRTVEIKDLFSTRMLVPILIASVLVGVATAIGSALCYVPGLIVSFFTQYTMFFLVDKELSAVDAIKASVAFVRENLGALVGVFLLSIVAFAVGGLLCGVGLLVAVPVVILAQTYAYRVLRGEPVVA